ncbi:MAG: hypothetical protein D6790_08570, partial [Caldilineae bacterium]
MNGLENWRYFSTWQDLGFAAAGLILGVLLMIWWRQQSERAYAVFAGTLFLAALLDAASAFVFVVPPHFVGCPEGCGGRLGYPLPFATVDVDGRAQVYLLDFLLNMLLLWLLWLGATVIWRMLSEAVELGERSFRFKLTFFFLLIVLPWALLPRYAAPPQPDVQGEELRLTINAQRAAEATYGVTGLWVQRLALEDIRYLPMQVPAVFGGLEQPQAQVCLRGYIWFYLPWRRYLITLDRTGVTALDMRILPLDGSCW